MDEKHAWARRRGQDTLAHAAQVQEFNGRAQLVASLGRFSSYCLYDGRLQARPQRM